MTHQELLAKGDQSLSTAEYLLFSTFQSLKDNKLLLTILSHLSTAADCYVSGSLEFGRLHHDIPPYNKNNDSVKMELFQKIYVPKLKLDKTVPAALIEMKTIKEKHEKAATEFSRRGKFVIADQQFQVVELTEKKIKEYHLLVSSLGKTLAAHVKEHEAAK